MIHEISDFTVGLLVLALGDIHTMCQTLRGGITQNPQTSLHNPSNYWPRWYSSF